MRVLAPAWRTAPASSFSHGGAAPHIRVRRGGRSKQPRACRTCTDGRSMRYLSEQAMPVATRCSGVLIGATIFFRMEIVLCLTQCTGFTFSTRAQGAVWSVWRREHDPNDAKKTSHGHAVARAAPVTGDRAGPRGAAGAGGEGRPKARTPAPRRPGRPLQRRSSRVARRHRTPRLRPRADDGRRDHVHVEVSHAAKTARPRA